MTQIQMPRPWAEGAERDAFWNAIDQAMAGEAAGFEYFWITEQHFYREIGHCSVCLPIMPSERSADEDLQAK